MYTPDVADILYGNYIKYDRMYEMTKFAFYGEIKSESVNIFIDVYSMMLSLFKRPEAMVKDRYVIASCLINLAIHMRAYFETRHRKTAKVYLVYGGDRILPKLDYTLNQSYGFIPLYNSDNVLMEDSNYVLQCLINENFEILQTLCPYIHDIFFISSHQLGFNVLVGDLDRIDDDPNIILSKDPMSYELVAYIPRTCMFRPKKYKMDDNSWVVTKSTLYNAYRHGELNNTSEIDVSLNPQLFSLFLSLAGVKSRSLRSLFSSGTSIKMIQKAIMMNIIPNDNCVASLLNSQDDIEILKLLQGTTVEPKEVKKRLALIDFPTKMMEYDSNFYDVKHECVNHYDPDAVREINNKYFVQYPLDLNRA